MVPVVLVCAPDSAPDTEAYQPAMEQPERRSAPSSAGRRPSPATPLNCPAGQAEHDHGAELTLAESDPVNPTLQKQSALSFEPAGAVEPASHKTQSDSASWPVNPLNFPDGQRSHEAAPTEALYLPTSQLLHEPLKVVVPPREPV